MHDKAMNVQNVGNNPCSVAKSEPTNVNTTKKETGNAPIQNTIGVQPKGMEMMTKPRDERRSYG